jgi:flagellar secretion chaperone FliS
MYASHRASNAYRAVDLQSAPKQEILRRLFDRCLLDMEQARQAIIARDIVTKSKAVDHALRIVNELEASLDHNSAPELCDNLQRLYNFVSERIHVASVKLETKPLDEAATLMAELAATFREATTRR